MLNQIGDRKGMKMDDWESGLAEGGPHPTTLPVCTSVRHEIGKVASLCNKLQTVTRDFRNEPLNCCISCLPPNSCQAPMVRCIIANRCE